MKRQLQLFAQDTQKVQVTSFIAAVTMHFNNSRMMAEENRHLQTQLDSLTYEKQQVLIFL